MTNLEYNATVHTYPENDLIEHERVGTGCLCGPDVEYVEGDTHWGIHITHHSLDGREFREES